MTEFVQPLSFLQKKKNEILSTQTHVVADLRAQTVAAEVIEVEIRATRNAFLECLYQHDLVEASRFTLALSDKVLTSALLASEASTSSRLQTVLPKTLGLEAFLEKNEWREVSQLQTLSASEIAHRLRVEFPEDCLLKPAIGHSSDASGFFIGAEKIAEHLLASAEEMILGAGFPWSLPSLAIPTLSSTLSGERFVLQSLVRGASGPIGPGCHSELRVHSYESDVIQGATFSRWDAFWDEDLFQKVEAKLEVFLKALPPALTKKQAWSFDIAWTPEDEIKILDLNTNRGQTIQWSGDLSLPDVLRAYARHFEARGILRFLGASGEELREGRAGRDKWIAKAGLEAVLRHEGLRDEARSRAATKKS